MFQEDHPHGFEDSMPMDLGTFVFDADQDLMEEDPMENDDRYNYYVSSSSQHGGSLPSLPVFSDARLPMLPAFGAPREETFGGEKMMVEQDPITGTAYQAVLDEVYLPRSERVQPYYGQDEEGICHAILAVAGYAGITSPLNLRILVSNAIAGGPLSPDKRQAPIETYRDNEDFSSAYLGLSMSAYAGPSGLVLKLPGRCLALLACGSEIVLIDPRDQPAKPSPSGLPQLVGEGALVMRCRDHLEVSVFIRGHYQTKPASAELFLLKDPATPEQTKEVTQSVEELSLDAPSRAVVDALDSALRSSATNKADVTFDSLNSALLGSITTQVGSVDARSSVKTPALPEERHKIVKLKDLYKNDGDNTLRDLGGIVIGNLQHLDDERKKTDNDRKAASDWKRSEKVKELFSGDPNQGIREDPVLPLQPLVPEPEKKNPEGKRERTPPTPPAAMGSPVRMESDDESGAEKPKRAKTPPLPVSTPVTAGPSAVVKAERRKSAPKAVRTSGTTTVTAVPAATAARKSGAEPPK